MCRKGRWCLVTNAKTAICKISVFIKTRLFYNILGINPLQSTIAPKAFSLGKTDYSPRVGYSPKVQVPNTSSTMNGGVFPVEGVEAFCLWSVIARLTLS